MSRHWQPKYPVQCLCGWKAKRTKFNTHKLCPRCGKYTVTPTAKKEG